MGSAVSGLLVLFGRFEVAVCVVRFAQFTGGQVVAGSNPAVPTKNPFLNQSVRGFIIPLASLFLVDW